MKCSLCGAIYDSSRNEFQVSRGNPIPTKDYAGKVCLFFRRRGIVEGCINPTTSDKSPWETYNGLNKKSEKVLREIGVDPSDINYLKSSGERRYGDSEKSN